MKPQQRRQFKVLIERDGDGFFVASVPALPGCHTQARTLTELSKRVQEAIRLCLEVAKTNARYRAKMRQFAYEPSFFAIETVTL